MYFPFSWIWASLEGCFGQWNMLEVKLWDSFVLASRDLLFALTFWDAALVNENELVFGGGPHGGEPWDCDSCLPTTSSKWLNGIILDHLAPIISPEKSNHISALRLKQQKNHLSEPSQKAWSRESWANMIILEPLNFRVVCYTAVDNCCRICFCEIKKII